MTERIKSPHQQRVEQMMHKVPQKVPGKPSVPPPETRVLRVRLMFEELMETAAAAGVSITLAAPNGEILALVHAPEGSIWPVEFSADGEFDLVEFVDGVADTIVTATGSFSAVGVPDETILKLVDENNLEKFGPGHYVDEGGKLIKPPGFKNVKPQIEAALADLSAKDCATTGKKCCGGRCHE